MFRLRNGNIGVFGFFRKILKEKGTLKNFELFDRSFLGKQIHKLLSLNKVSAVKRQTVHTPHSIDC